MLHAAVSCRIQLMTHALAWGVAACAMLTATSVTRAQDASDGGAVFPPGVYTQARLGSAEDMEYDRAMGCARRPMIFYPDGKMVGKELDSMRGEAGLPPYRIQVDGQCSLVDGILDCDATYPSPSGEPDQRNLTASLRELGNGDYALSEDDGFLQCNLADLDQDVGGRNVLGEILRRDDDGPFPPIGTVALDLEAYRGTGVAEVAKGSWHGAVNGTMQDGAVVLSIDIVQAASNPADAYGDHYFYVEDANSACEGLSEIACGDLRALSAVEPSTRGSILVEGKLISAFAVENSAAPADLRLSVVEKQSDGNATLSIFHPEHGAILTVTAPFEPHWCDSSGGNPGDDFCIATAGQLGALSDPEKAKQAHGIFGTTGNLLEPFFSHIPELQALFSERTSSSEQPAESLGALPVGIYANLLNTAPTADWVAERCETSPTIFYPDGMVVSKIPGANNYIVDQSLQCQSLGQGASCTFEDTPDGVIDVAFNIIKTAGGFEMCAQGDQVCETFHQCSGDLIASSLYAGLVARDDGGAPLPGN